MKTELASIKAENNAAEAKFKSVQDEREAAERHVDEDVAMFRLRVGVEHIEAKIKVLLEDPKQKVPHALMKHAREVIVMMKTAFTAKEREIERKDEQLDSTIAAKNAAEAKLKSSVPDEKESTARNVKFKQGAYDTTHIHNADTDDDEMGDPEKKKQKTEKA